MAESDQYARLAADSVKLIAWNQHPEGGYIASPLFSHYAFSWLRDGSFIAYGMDCAGEHDSSLQFYEWVRTIMERKLPHIACLVGKHYRGERIEQHEFLHTRYHLDGRDDEHSEWGHFQMDGYGTWLWGLCEHLKATGHTSLPERFRAAVDASVQYVEAFWGYPNFDCWEEYPDNLHPSTLACLYGGLRAIAELGGRTDLDELCDTIQSFLLKYTVHEEGHFVKRVYPSYEQNGLVYRHGDEGVDASLLWLCEPFRVFEPSHPAMVATVCKVEAELRTSQGGVRRYVGDSYYGGGEWLLLTAWYGWCALRQGRREVAEQALEWIASKSDRLGRLPEQVPDALPDRVAYDDWVRRWGPPATPLLWSHGMYLVLYNKLKQSKPES
ncbi:glycoside hydrolase family 15 protein [Paenibacillus sp. YYML68]|uniref:glycoside hydrolase family 15 protein n=1 Tax=Paenibacillus sp. YYML68 TaxID=2909250 RepID=UPI002492274F|nr:glycoside hydrolase family 15 protein [Paenibacillus sp. YYML68]